MTFLISISADVSYSPSTSSSRTCCGSRATIVGPFARTSMNLNRAILPCPLDFPVAIASTRRNNIHLTFCRASTWAYAPLFQSIRSRTEPFQFLWLHLTLPVSLLILTGSGKVSTLKEQPLLSLELAHTCARLISHGDAISEIRGNSNSEAIRSRMWLCETPPARVFKMTDFFSSLFLTDPNAIWPGGPILIDPRHSRVRWLRLGRAWSPISVHINILEVRLLEGTGWW